jgi:hypothetical protein
VAVRGPLTAAQVRDKITPQRLINTVLVIVVALEALEDIKYGFNRASRAANEWWRGLEHRERRLLHEGEAGFIVRLLDHR